MVVRATTAGWVPLFDAAYFTVRSRDVATVHNPLVGAWSMGSREVGAWVNNLGPLQLDLLAPFTRLDAYWGTAVGVGATNVAAIVGVWLVARRLFATIGVVGAMGATVLLQLNEGSLMLIEARQQLALILPMWCLLWLAAATWRGDRWCLPWLAFVSSFVLQTHFTYAYQTVAVSIAAVAAIVVHRRSRLRELARPALATAAVVAVCWIQPLWDQFLGTGNMSAVLEQSGGSERSVGISRGLRILAESAFVPPFFAPGSMGDLLREGPRVSWPGAVLALTAWAVALVAAVWVLRRRQPALVAMASVSLVALASSAYAVTKIPPTEQFGIIAQNYYWAWPVAVFAGTSVIGAALHSPIGQLRSSLGEPGWAPVPALAAGVVVLGVVPILSPTNALPETDHEWHVSRRLARPLMDEFGAQLDALDLRDPVLIDLGGVRHVRYTLLTELQARGIDFRFAPGSTDLSRFGRKRCDDGSARYLITLRGGPQAVMLNSPDTLLAFVPGVTADQLLRANELGATFGDALRDGTVVVDDARVELLGGEVPPHLALVRSTAKVPARHLSEFLDTWRHFDAVVVADHLEDELGEWRALERSASADRMALYLREIATDRPDRCGEIDPGEEFLASL